MRLNQIKYTPKQNAVGELIVKITGIGFLGDAACSEAAPSDPCEEWETEGYATKEECECEKLGETAR